MEQLQKIKDLLGDRFKENQILSQHTTFRIGGPAKYFALIQSVEELEIICQWAEKKQISVFVMGGGSNVLVSNTGFDGLVIRLLMSKVKRKEEGLECDAGAFLSKSVGESLGAGLIGLEWAVGVPGTIGGAVRGNAGAYGGATGDSVESVTVLRNGKIKELKNKDCHFDYRESIFKANGNHDIIISATFKLKRGNDQELLEAKERMKKIARERSAKMALAIKIEGQEECGYCAGSIFKNVVLTEKEVKEFKNKFPAFPEEFIKFKKIPASWLIDQLNLKGKSIGGASVSYGHAGFIINNGTATAENIIMLVSIIKQKVRDHFGIQLMEEIEYVGF